MSDDQKKDDAVDLSGFDTGSEAPTDAEAKLEQALQELEKAKKDYLYLRADFDNYKRSAIKERSDLIKYGNERVTVDVLNLVDTFDQALALEITAENFGSFRQGMEMLRTEFQNMFSRMGIQKVESQGEPFNPSIHEAISSEPTNEVPAGHIARVFKPAYKLHDKVIRTAQVVVATPLESDDKPG